MWSEKHGCLTFSEANIETRWGDGFLFLLFIITRFLIPWVYLHFPLLKERLD